MRSIGISNFERSDSYKDILAGFETTPAIAQMERHIAFSPDTYVEDLRSRGIACEAWFPLGGTMSQKAQLNLPEVQQVAMKHGKTGAQVLLRWQLQTGFAAVPGSANEEHIADNLDIFDFTLDEEDLAALAKATSGKRVFAVALSAQVDMIMGFKFND